MAVFRVEKSRGYTVMSNHHLRNKELSLKAKGLLSQTENFYAVLERQRKLEKEVSAIVKGTGAKGAGSRRRNKA